MPRKAPRSFHEAPPGRLWCGACRRFKPLSEFWRSRRRPSGYQPRCKPCHLAAHYVAQGRTHYRGVRLF